jgi:hypothetical protein
MHLKRYLATGEARSLWHDDLAAREQRAGALPVRASRIEVVPEGPGRGRFAVDFSLLAAHTGCDRYRCCLRQTFPRYDQANAAEVAWLLEHYVRGA